MFYIISFILVFIWNFRVTSWSDFNRCDSGISNYWDGSIYMLITPQWIHLRDIFTCLINCYMRRDRLLIRRMGKYCYYNRDKLSINFISNYTLDGRKISSIQIICDGKYKHIAIDFTVDSLTGNVCNALMVDVFPVRKYYYRSRFFSKVLNEEVPFDGFTINFVMKILLEW